MLTILRPQLFQERITAGHAGLQVHAFLIAGAEQEAFRFDAAQQSAADLLRNLAERFHEHQASLSTRQPPSQSEDAWYEIANGAEKLVASEADVQKLVDLREALLTLDRTGGLALRSTREWLKLAAAGSQAGDFDRAFRCASAALDRVRLPHLAVRMKDDSFLKYRAAQETFASGRRPEAVAMVTRLAESRLNLLEQAWK